MDDDNDPCPRDGSPKLQLVLLKPAVRELPDV